MSIGVMTTKLVALVSRRYCCIKLIGRPSYVHPRSSKHPSRAQSQMAVPCVGQLARHLFRAHIPR